MGETETSKTKISDSGYSNSSTSQYPRSNGSSKSRHSSSSGSSGYSKRPSVLSSGNDEAFPQPPQMSAKRKKKMRKQLKKAECLSSSSLWDQENGRGGIEVVGAGTTSGVASSVAIVNGSSGIGPTTVMPVSSIGPEVASVMVNSSAVEVQSSGDPEVLQIAPLTQTLNCFKKMKGKDSTLNCLQGENGIQRATNDPLTGRVKEHIANCFNGDTSNAQAEGEGFVVVVSMADGSVVHTTRNLTTALGFPDDMWLGRDFIDFIHPKDRMAFAGHITSGVARGEDISFKGFSNKTSFYCSLRQYHGLQNVGYGSAEKRVPYLPFRLTLTFREMNFSMAKSQMASSSLPLATSLSSAFQNKQSGIKDSGLKASGELNDSVFLVITAARIYSAYKGADEELFPSAAKNSPFPTSPSPVHSQSVLPLFSHVQEEVIPFITTRKFVTRHLSSCRLSHVDPAAVPYLGFLPQDMETRSVMDFYHPEDMPILKDAYQNVMSQQIIPYKGKPYRFRTQNGTYALIETEWSSFVNPWSRKLEFVIGQHRLLKGPSNPDVFAEPTKDDCPQFSDEVLKESERIQEEIIFMLDQERDSVMLGEISPHHDYYDGKSSTETPPSYNQINYNENIQRFFESKPKTTLSDESSEMKIEGSSSNNRSPNLSTDEEGKISPIPINSSSGSDGGRKCCSQAHESDSGGSGSRAGGETGGGGVDSSHEDPGEREGGNEGGTSSKLKGSRGTGGGAKEATGKSKIQSAHENSRISNHRPTDKYQPPHLTEALLSRHNEDMEKIMVQKHREQRSLDREGKLKDGRKSNHEKSQDPMICHGVKRSGSLSWEREPQRVKHQHIELPQQHNGQGIVVGPWELNSVNPPITVPATTATLVPGSTLAPVITSASSAVPKNSKHCQPGLQMPGQTTSSSLPSLNLWPPFSVMLMPIHNSQPCLSHSCPGITHNQHLHPILSSSTPPVTLQPSSEAEFLPPPSHQFPLSLHHPFTHSLNPHPQGLIPVYYVPTAAVGIASSLVDAENSSSPHPHHIGSMSPQVQQQQIPGFPYLMPSPHSQSPGLSPAAGTLYIPNHMQCLSSIPQMVYQAIGPAQFTGPESPQMLFPSMNNLASPFPPQLSPSSPAEAPSQSPQLPPSHQPSVSNLHYTHLRHSSKNQHKGHMLHHIHLPRPQSAGVKELSRQGNLLRGRDGLGVLLMTRRDSHLVPNNLKDGNRQEELRDREGNNFDKCQYPASQDTSVKAEPGSAVGSITSTSGLRELSEASKKCKSAGYSAVCKQTGAEEFKVNTRDWECREDIRKMEDGGKGKDICSFRLFHDQDTVLDDSSYSSLYSFLRTEKSDDSMKCFPWDSKGEMLESDAMDDMKVLGSKNYEKGTEDKLAQKPVRKVPSWLEEVDVTPDLVFRYKMDDQILHNVLEADLKTLKNIHQSTTVNEQLSQLYMDMELEGATTRLSLEDSAGFTSSSGTDEASIPFGTLNMNPSSDKGASGELIHRIKKKRRTMEYGKLMMIFEENAPFPPPLPVHS